MCKQDCISFYTNNFSQSELHWQPVAVPATDSRQVGKKKSSRSQYHDTSHVTMVFNVVPNSSHFSFTVWYLIAATGVSLQAPDCHHLNEPVKQLARACMNQICTKHIPCIYHVYTKIHHIYLSYTWKLPTSRPSGNLNLADLSRQVRTSYSIQ